MENLFYKLHTVTYWLSSSQLLWTKEVHQSRFVRSQEEPKVAKRGYTKFIKTNKIKEENYKRLTIINSRSSKSLICSSHDNKTLKRYCKYIGNDIICQAARYLNYFPSSQIFKLFSKQPDIISKQPMIFKDDLKILKIIRNIFNPPPKIVFRHFLRKY